MTLTQQHLLSGPAASLHDLALPLLEQVGAWQHALLMHVPARMLHTMYALCIKDFNTDLS